MALSFQGSGAAQAPAPPPPPALPVPAIATPDQVAVIDNSPSAFYEAARNQRRELMNQLDRMVSQREDLADEISEANTAGVPAEGLTARLQAIDQRIASVEAEIAIADASVARAAAIPGAIVPPPPPPPETGPPEEFWVLSGIFMFVVILPLTIAYARRLWRRGAVAMQQIPAEFYERFTRLEQGMDAIAIEVERVGESQRYLTRLYAERGLGAGAAQPIAGETRVGDRQER